MTSSDREWIPDPPDARELEDWDLDPAWSRCLDVVSHDGSTRRWHMLDTGTSPQASATESTILCVHGNPTWAYAWASLLRQLRNRARVIAVDQLGMGYSERTHARSYSTRVADLADLVDALGIDRSQRLVVAAHDWGGAISLGWAVEHRDQVDGLVLCNTGIAVPAGRSSPGLIRLAASPALRDLVCRRTSIFVDGASGLSGSKLSKADRQAFRAPYRTAASRAAIADFVGDVPLVRGGGHPSDAAIAAVADRLESLDIPVLLAWGTADPVFNDDFAADLAERLPQTDLQRFPTANHLVMAEADVAGAVDLWLADRFAASPQPHRPQESPQCERRPLWSGIDQRRVDNSVAVDDRGANATLTWAALAERVDRIAVDLTSRGLQPGDRVAMLTPPGVDLVSALYGVWRAGGVAVVADRGLGLVGLRRAVRGTRPAWVIGPRRVLAVAKAMRFAPRASFVDVADLVAAPPRGDVSDLEVPDADADAAILFTSGATGPAKGVRYLHGQLEAQRDALAVTYSIGSDDRLVAAFAPFALYGPALGIPSALPDCDVTAPAQLTAAALDEACAAVDATLAFASPAALTNVIETAPTGSQLSGLAELRLVMSAGAPVSAEILTAMATHTPRAELHTPYGMTEVLPVADVDLDGIVSAELANPTGGVCVGHAVAGAEIVILPLHFDSIEPPEPLPVGETGEIVIWSSWMSDGYLGLWAVERDARPTRRDERRWHRSGDVGHLDAQGRLWVEGRIAHVIESADGPLPPVPIERSIERVLHGDRVAAVGVGPRGRQQLVVVVESSTHRDGLAPLELTTLVRSSVSRSVAAVLTRAKLPVDIRHNAKIDRTAVADWAATMVEGGSSTRRSLTRLKRR